MLLVKISMTLIRTLKTVYSDWLVLDINEYTCNY